MTAVTHHRAPAPSSPSALNDTVCNACLNGDVDVLRREPFNPQAPILEGLYPVHVAAAAGQDGIIRALAGMGADLEQIDCKANRNTALHFAVLARKANVVRTLLEAGVDVDPENCVGTTPIHDAARVGDEEIVDKLVRHGAAWSRPNAYGNTILHRAALYGHVALVQWIGRHMPAARQQSFLSARNLHDYTARDIAVSRGMRAMTRALAALDVDHSEAAEKLLKKPYSEREAWDAFQKKRLDTDEVA